jgi:hypothetical protein
LLVNGGKGGAKILLRRTGLAGVLRLHPRFGRAGQL